MHLGDNLEQVECVGIRQNFSTMQHACRKVDFIYTFSSLVTLNLTPRLLILVSWIMSNLNLIGGPRVT